MKQLNQYRLDCAQKQKRGLHFILASVVIWCAMTVIYFSELPILTKNLFAFICTGMLLPLSNLGLLFSLNQLLYLLIAMWIYPTIPEKMIMVLAIIFGAHLMPFSWLYRSKVYFVLSIIIPFFALIIGLNFDPAILSMSMVGVEIIFCVLLSIENRRLNSWIADYN